MQEIDDTYKTIAVPSKGIFKNKGSKFMAFAYPVMSEVEAKQHINYLKKEYYDARHHCFAYALGIKRELFRTSDDGEPQGTAGKPIFGQIQSFGLTNIIIIVVRYFGGILLGKSGLINAYRNAANDSLQNATITKKTLNKFFKLSFDYKVMNNVMNFLKEENIEQIQHNFDLSCDIIISVKLSKIDKISKKLKDIESVKFDILNSELSLKPNGG